MQQNSKVFNTSGPCNPADHYMLDPLARLGDLRKLIDGKNYFVIHAPRQTGKTTLLRALAKKLTEEGHYAALHFSCERGQPFADVSHAERAIVEAIYQTSLHVLPDELQSPECPQGISAGSLLQVFLTNWSLRCPRPLVLFFDEIDALIDRALETVLRQLRDGFTLRPKHFPHSVILCGLRDAAVADHRDYKVASGGSPTLGTASPFNIKSDSIRLGNFTKEDIAELYYQHTDETGQVFEPEALAKAWELTEGQPWLVNALVREILFGMKTPVTQSITSELMVEAGQHLILARQTHLDSLVSKLHEDRVRGVLEPVLAGTIGHADATYNDDVSYVRDLGLLSLHPPLRIANAIYREVIVRVLSERTSDSIVFERPSFVGEGGRLDVGAIVSEFALWWQEHADALLQGNSYNEVAAQLIFMAWLQRVVNGGGFIDREYGIGRGRIDVLIRWPLPQAPSPAHWQREAFELKVWWVGRPDPLAQGLTQLERYLDGLGLQHGTLVIFDRRPNALPPAERTAISVTTTPKGYRVRLLRA